MNWRLYLAAMALALALLGIFLFHLPAQFPYSCEQPGVRQGVER